MAKRKVQSSLASPKAQGLDAAENFSAADGTAHAHCCPLSKLLLQVHRKQQRKPQTVRAWKPTVLIFEVNCLIGKSTCGDR
jgi:hypothetical protein